MQQGNFKYERQGNTPLKKLRVLAVLFGLLALLYTGWEIYWWQIVGYRFVKWHTHFAFIVIPFALLAAVVYALFSILLKAYRTNVLLLVLAVGFSLLLAETIQLVRVEFFEAPTYLNLTRVNEKNNYHVWKEDTVHWLDKDEFHYIRYTNHLGFADSQWVKPKAPNTFRVISLGDSYTEGDGAPQDSAYPVLLQTILKQPYPNVEVMNAGTCGSDPFFNFYNLQKRLIDYQPDVVVQTLSSHDILSDIWLRGGMERFVNDSTIAVKLNPSLRLFYECSYLFCYIAEKLDRAYLDSKLFETNTNRQLTELITNYRQLSNNYGFKIIWVLLPAKFEAVNKVHTYNFSTIKESLQKINGVPPLDLIPVYQTYAAQHQQPVSSYYWNIDAHHNSQGYQMMASVIADSVIQYLPENK
jgi:lysophospholipase L1-like esterase